MIHECKCLSPSVFQRDWTKFYTCTLCVHCTVTHILKIVLDWQQNYKCSRKMGKRYEKVVQREKISILCIQESLLSFIIQEMQIPIADWFLTDQTDDRKCRNWQSGWECEDTGTQTCWYAKSWYHWLILCKLKPADLTSPNFGDLPSGFICKSTENGVNKIVHYYIISNSWRKIIHVMNNPCVDQQ